MKTLRTYIKSAPVDDARHVLVSAAAHDAVFTQPLAAVELKQQQTASETPKPARHHNLIQSVDPLNRRYKILCTAQFLKNGVLHIFCCGSEHKSTEPQCLTLRAWLRNCAGARMRVCGRRHSPGCAAADPAARS